MCRLALLNKDGVLEMENKHGLLKFLDYLEKANGGQGNGFTLFKDGKIVDFKKGVKLSNGEILEALYGVEFDWFLYHTRIVSKGNVCDEQCHPFVSPKEDFALAMNGTESHFGEIGKLMGTSDTDALFRIYHAFNMDVETLKSLDSRFMGFKKGKGKKGKVFFTNSAQYYSSLELMTTKKGSKAIVVASSFPVLIESEKIESSYYWEEGKKIKTSAIKYTKYNFREQDNDYLYNYTRKSPCVVYECPTCHTVSKYNGFANKQSGCWERGKCQDCGSELVSVSCTEKEEKEWLEYGII